MAAAIDQCDEGTLRRLLQAVIRKVPECRRKIAEDLITPLTVMYSEAVQ